MERISCQNRRRFSKSIKEDRILTIKAKKFQLTLATLVTPYIERSVGRYCQWFNSNDTDGLSKAKTSLQVQFGDGKVIDLSDNHLMNTERSKFDYSKFPDDVPKRDTNFVNFAAEQTGEGRSFWNFVLAENKLDEIEENGKNGSRVQLFNISFDNSIQCDPNIKISANKGPPSGLLFNPECEGLSGVGIVENHRSITTSKYEELTGEDPVILFARQNYYDPFYHDNYSEHMTFYEYSNREIQRFS